MRRDDLSDWVGIDKPAEKNKWHEMVVQDVRIEVEVGRNKCPSNCEGYEADEGIAGLVAFGTASFNNIHRSVAD